jgi:hypothetical protein
MMSHIPHRHRRESVQQIVVLRYIISSLTSIQS